MTRNNNSLLCLSFPHWLVLYPLALRSVKGKQILGKICLGKIKAKRYCPALCELAGGQGWARTLTPAGRLVLQQEPHAGAKGQRVHTAPREVSSPCKKGIFLPWEQLVTGTTSPGASQLRVLQMWQDMVPDGLSWVPSHGRLEQTLFQGPFQPGLFCDWNYLLILINCSSAID